MHFKHTIRILSLFVFSTFLATDYEIIDLSDNKEKLSKEILIKFKKEHFIKNISKQTTNTDFIEGLINKLDESKSYFLDSEVNGFLSRSVSSSNDYDMQLAFEITNLYFERLVDFSEHQIKLITDNKFDMSKDEKIDIFEDDNLWLRSHKQQKELWRKQTKNDLLLLKISDSPPDNPSTNLIKRYKNRIKRISQQKEEDIFSLIINVLSKEFDPHSSYLSPRSSEDFDMDMSLKLEGIGALLGVEDDYTKIISLVSGGPAEKSGLIKPEDKVISIRQGDEKNYEDVIGWRIDDVVNLIRGKSGTQVEIEFLTGDSLGENSKKKVTLTREEVKLEDRAVKSKVFEFNDSVKNQKIGIIDLPSFYMDFNAYMKKDPEYKSSSRDIKKILKDFSDENVDAVILDLRSNGGGALDEANRIIGLFINKGPTVQVKLKSGYVRPWGSQKNQQVWSKPVIVLVNRYSASASEIVAAAIQDYKRGIIVGQRTFGKGTVQSLQDLSEGAIKVTESKYYRVNGKSVQNKGVLPDIRMPSTWDIDSVGESSYPSALEWDTIKPYRYSQFKFDPQNLVELKVEFSKRTESDANLGYLQSVRERYDLNKNKKFLSLNIDKRISQKKLNRNWMLDLENKRRFNLGLNQYKDYDELTADKDESDDSISLKKDFILNEAINIAKDYIDLDSNLLAIK
tara:strand:- start:3693 stop:5735 length:2043 start_codon:yes stop_codon:yes gene_type:complete